MTDTDKPSSPPPEPILDYLQAGVSDALGHGAPPLVALFGELGLQIVAQLPRNPERTVALRKLMESLDCTMRVVRGA